MEPGTDRPGRQAERIGDLGGLPVEVMAEHDHDAMIGRQLPKRSFDPVAVVDIDRGVVVCSASSRSPAVRARPLRLAITVTDEDARRPGVEQGRVAERPQVAPGVDQRVLDRVLRLVDVTQDPERDPVEPMVTERASTSNASWSPPFARNTRSPRVTVTPPTPSAGITPRG